MTQLKDVAGQVYMGKSFSVSSFLVMTYCIAAHDSVIAAIQTFILAMTCYPEIQKRVQQELDDVVGPHRLPIHADILHLPYLSAVIKEVLRYDLSFTCCLVPNHLIHRWQVVIPAGTYMDEKSQFLRIFL
jgi:cytochrome P450